MTSLSPQLETPFHTPLHTPTAPTCFSGRVRSRDAKATDRNDWPTLWTVFVIPLTEYKSWVKGRHGALDSTSLLWEEAVREGILKWNWDLIVLGHLLFICCLFLSVLSCRSAYLSCLSHRPVGPLVCLVCPFWFFLWFVLPFVSVYGSHDIAGVARKHKYKDCKPNTLTYSLSHTSFIVHCPIHPLKIPTPALQHD